MRYLVYNREADKIVEVEERPPLEDKFDVFMPIYTTGFLIRQSDYFAYKSHQFAMESFCIMYIDGEEIKGYLSERDDRNKQMFAACEGRKLKTYVRERKDVYSDWNEWKLNEEIELK